MQNKIITFSVASIGTTPLQLTVLPIGTCRVSIKPFSTNTASGSSVAFSELGTTYTTVADGASLAISSTSTPNLFVKANITANRLYSSSNDFNASSDKDGSLKQTITYQVVQ